jgi:uncharacterized membrane protein YphA (DoxX/SURF4 family)
MSLKPVELPRPLHIFIRVTVGMIFMLMALWKIGDNHYAMGGRVGELFNSLEATGLWWDLVGWTQLLAGILLCTRRFTTPAALLLFGVTINIAAVNLSLWPEFGTTMVLTAYALLGLGILLLHDLDRWQYIFWKEPPVLADTRDTPARHSPGTRPVPHSPVAG